MGWGGSLCRFITPVENRLIAVIGRFPSALPTAGSGEQAAICRCSFTTDGCSVPPPPLQTPPRPLCPSGFFI